MSDSFFDDDEGTSPEQGGGAGREVNSFIPEDDEGVEKVEENLASLSPPPSSPPPRPTYVRPEIIPELTFGNGIYGFRSYTFSKINYECCKDNFIALDFCCEAGTNIRRWPEKKFGHVVLADSSREALRQAINVYNSSEVYYSATPILVDCFAQLPTTSSSSDIFDYVLDGGISFDHVLCTSTAALRAFSSYSAATAFLRNATSRIRPGGTFAIFFPDAETIMKLRKPFWNPYCFISYDESNTSDFGVPCTIAIAGQNGLPMPNSEGYLIKSSALIKILQDECNMSFSKQFNFDETLSEFKRISSITDDEVLVMSLFTTLIFEKRPLRTKFHDQF